MARLTPMTDRTIIRLFAKMRWTMLRGVLRDRGPQKWAVVIGLVAAVGVGTLAGVMLFVAGRRADDPATLFSIATTALAAVVVMIGVIAGISQPVDPRVLATEPLTDRQLGVALLAASAAGPPGLSAVLVGAGLFGGAVRGPASVIPVLLAVAMFLATLLLVSRSTINTLGLFATRFPRAGQVVVGVSSLLFYAAFQLAPRMVGDLDGSGRERLADLLSWTPPGQIGRALGTAGDEPVRALAGAALAAVWLVPLAWIFVWTTRALVVTVRRSDARTASRHARGTGVVATVARRLCGRGARGAVAWRGVLTRMRTPRSALETFTGAGIGLAIVLVPALTRDEAGAGAVLVGGAVQLAVLFMAGNSFGSDGPALASELLTGVDPHLLVAAKARSVVVVASPLAVIGPLIAAAVTGEWNYLPAGILVGWGGLLAGAGGAVVQSTLVPIAVPEGDNPLAAGDSGKGCLAGIILGAVLLALAVVTLPVALALLWAVDRESVVFVTICALATLGAGLLVLRAGVRYASARWRRSEPEFYAAVVPAR
jgi:ABC-2 type transport system permease protein